MISILDTIIAHKRIEVAERKISHPLQLARENQGRTTSGRDFWRMFENEKNALIGEIKPKSPSHGTLTNDPLDCARIYGSSPIDCISVLTDEKFFGGSLELLQKVRTLTTQPLFRKDFVIDVYQIAEAAHHGADALLFIASILDAETLAEYIGVADSFGMGHIVETHTEADIQKALASGARCVGINNRNLTTLAIDLATTESLIHLIPSHIPVVSESGIRTVDDAIRMKKSGARGILVGASILDAANRANHITQLKQVFT